MVGVGRRCISDYSASGRGSVGGVSQTILRVVGVGRRCISDYSASGRGR